MQLKFFKLVLPAILLLGAQVYAQDTITLMSGKVIDCSIGATDQTELEFDVTKKNGKTKFGAIHKSDIFSYQIANQPETILYAKDAVLGDDLSVDDMRTFIAGEQDAYDNYNPKIPFYGGIVFGAATAYYGDGNLIWTVVPPLIWAFGQLLPPLKIKERYISDLGYQYNDLYARGFEKVARGKKVRKALLGAVIGSAAGLVVSQID